MIHLLGCILLTCLSTLVYSETPLGPYARPAGIIPPVNPIRPSSPLYPYAGHNPLIPGYHPPNPVIPGYNTPNPLISGYNNPYYKGGVAVPILTYSNERGIDGSYAYSFSTADGKQAQESGFLKDAYIDNKGEPQGTQVVEGSYAYISPEGTPIQVNYVADENGFRPSGVHIPADGKGVAPLLPVGIKNQQGKYDPLHNRYNPYNYRKPYYGQYNNPIVNARPYDPRYPYNPQLNLHTPYRPWGLNKEVKEETKKETA